MSTGEAAEMLSITPNTVRNWIKSGELEAVVARKGGRRVYRVLLTGRLAQDGENGFAKPEAKNAAAVEVEETVKALGRFVGADVGARLAVLMEGVGEERAARRIAERERDECREGGA